MIDARTDRNPGNWQLTATTVKCDYVDDFITLMVYKDWATKCTWYRKYKETSPSDKKRKLAKEIRQKVVKCAGPECPLAINYRDKLINEEPVIKAGETQ
jgi:hypothetical protein